REQTSGERSLCLYAPGQQAEYVLPIPLTAGRAGINFRGRSEPTGSAWQWEAEFVGSTGWAMVRVGVALHTRSYEAEVSGAAGTGARLPRKDGWQRLEMTFDRDRLALSIDDDILWSARQPGAGGALCRGRLRCAASPPHKRADAKTYFDAFSLAQPLPWLPHPKGDPEQDELWLLSGDQVFGKLTRATAHGIQLQGAFGPRIVRWGDVRGIYFRSPTSPSTPMP